MQQQEDLKQEYLRIGNLKRQNIDSSENESEPLVAWIGTSVLQPVHHLAEEDLGLTNQQEEQQVDQGSV